MKIQGKSAKIKEFFLIWNSLGEKLKSVKRPKKTKRKISTENCFCSKYENQLNYGNEKLAKFYSKDKII